MDEKGVTWNSVEPSPTHDRARRVIAIGLIVIVLGLWLLVTATIGFEAARETGLLLSLTVGLAIVLIVGEVLWFAFARELNRNRIVRVGFDGATLYLERGHGVESLPFTQIRSVKRLPSGRLRIERQAGSAYKTEGTVSDELVHALSEKIQR